MSKIGKINLALEEQANQLGFETVSEAREAGCIVDWDNIKLIEPLEAAHRDFEERRAKVIAGLKEVRECIDSLKCGNMTSKIDEAVKFIEEGEYI